MLVVRRPGGGRSVAVAERVTFHGLSTGCPWAVRDQSMDYSLLGMPLETHLKDKVGQVTGRDVCQCHLFVAMLFFASIETSRGESYVWLRSFVTV